MTNLIKMAYVKLGVGMGELKDIWTSLDPRGKGTCSRRRLLLALGDPEMQARRAQGWFKDGVTAWGGSAIKTEGLL